HDRQMSRKHHQYSVAKSCTELEGKYLAMFKENQQLPTVQLEPPSEEEQEIYREAAKKLCELEAKKKRIEQSGPQIKLHGA
ncbi:MAG: hypothetical protein ACYSUL_09570, partial [Planctomycetota bacterium]